MYTGEISFLPEMIKKIVRCVEEAVGDDIQADIQKNDFVTNNSLPSRIWDILNTNIMRTLDAEEWMIAKAHRGPWEMLVVYEKTSHCILTFMREKRFSDLQKNQRKRMRMHYVDILAKQFNSDLLPGQQQLSIYPHTFSDEDRLTDLVQSILQDFEFCTDVVRHHVLVLFDTVGFQLTHIRAVMVTPSLEIAQGSEQDWSDYIAADESAVVEKITHPEAPSSQPNRGLALKAKAMARQKNRPKQKEHESFEKKES